MIRRFSVISSLCVVLFMLALQTVAAAAQTAPDASSVNDLIRLLEDPAAREALLTQLRSAAQEAAPTVATEPSIAEAIAEQTRAAAEQVAIGGATIWGGIMAISGLFTGGVDYSRLQGVALNLLLAGGALIGTFLLLRGAAFLVQRRLDTRVAGRRWPVRALGVALAFAVDVVIVALAWGAGYVIALQLAGGRMDLSISLLLNAFLVVEAAKLLLRLVLQPRLPALRMIPMCDTTAAYWYFWLARAVSLLGYTFMFVAPVLASSVSDAVGQAVRVLVMLSVLVIAVVIVLQNRDRLREALYARANAGKGDMIGRLCAIIAGVWHLIALTYLVAIFIVWLVNPTEALPFMIGATVRTVVSIGLGLLVITFIAQAANAGLRLPADIRARLPALEYRLRAYVPHVMTVIRTLVAAAVVISIAQAWGMVDFASWIASDSGQRVFGSIFAAGAMIVMGFLAYLAMASWVEYRLNPQFGTIPTPREKTLLALFRNAFTIALVVMVAMLALGQIGVNIAPLLAGAGVLGLAIGFGAQKLVQDIITGVFIQLENIMNEGDVVTLGGITGTVEKLTIRSVSVRSLDGTLHLIPFSSVDTVSNMMKGFGYHMAEIRVAYREDIGAVKAAMQEAFDLLMQTEWADQILEPLEMHGVTAFDESAVTVRARIKTVAGSQWAAGRAYNELIRNVFDRRGIRIPTQHIRLFNDDAAPQLTGNEIT